MRKHAPPTRRPIVRSLGQNLGTLSLMGLGLLMGLGTLGCGGPEPLSFSSITHTTREELVEVKLGSFIVPVPLVLDNTEERFEVDNRVQIDFDLVAIVYPGKLATVNRLKKLHAGKIRDEVMRVCRNTPHDDIVEADWSTFKAHLLDAIQPLLGGDSVRRVATPRIIKELL